MSEPKPLGRYVPSPLRSAIWKVRREVRAARYILRDHVCPLCGNERRFLVVNDAEARAETLCLRCHSLERHRRAVLFLRRATDLYSVPLRVLHVAPEESLRRELGELEHLSYVTGDLLAPDVDVRLDLTDIEFDDESFDVVLCSHVLEHVPDDRKAMREIHRILKRTGWALINVPSDPARTAIYEDPSVVSPDARLSHFGQEDHVRVYSSDGFMARLRECGFSVERDPMPFTPEEVSKYLLDGDAGWDHMYLCRRAD